MLRIVTGCRVIKIKGLLSNFQNVRVLKDKKKLKGMKLSSIGITTPVYINDSLSSYYKRLWRKCRKLWSSKFIHTFWVSNGSIKLKIADNDRVYTITYNKELEELFPGNELLLKSK